MPIYEYECNPCGFRFERKQRFDEEAITKCPKCEGETHRVINSVPIIFKGSGFYTTDNRKDSAIEKAEERMPAKDKQMEK